MVANPTSAPKRAQVTLLGSNQATPVKQDITVPPRSNYTLAVGNLVTATFVSAIVELEGGDGVVEQRALFPAGNAVSSCITQTSSTWYFADGFTVDRPDHPDQPNRQ